MLWYIASIVISECSAVISSEKQMGTFTQLLLKPVSLLNIIFVRVIVYTTFSFIKIAILISFALVFFDLPIAFNPLIIICFLFVFIFLISVGILISCMTIKYTKTASFGSLISYFILLFSGIIIPLSELPTLVSKISQYTPITLAVTFCNELLNYNRFNGRALSMLTGMSIVSLFLSLLIYKLLKNNIHKKGFNTDY